MTDIPVLIRARRLACEAELRGGALEAGILSGSCDNGTLVGDFMDEAEQELLREQMEENIPDD
tara:strand:+ start:505 stop:693 length:189 start_codon:yes stop_codon:yes gene_type:complete